MKHLRPVIGILLLFALLLSVFPAVPVLGAVGIDRPEAMPQNARAVSVGSVSVPSYSGGTSSGWMTYDCGSNLSRGDTGTQSKMRIVKNTTAAQFNTYVTTLKNQGYKTLYEKKVPAQSNYNIHHKFLSPDGSHALYTYFVDAYKETRIIVDTNRDTLRIYDYKSMGMGSGNGRTEVYMIPISASPDGFYYDSNYSLYKQNNAGALMVIKMADNSLFVVDGGSYVQMSDRDCERIYAFLRRITDIPEGQKIYINTWFVTHYHDDHVSGFSRLMYKYNTEFELQNVMYNFDVVGHSGDNMQIIGELFPNARYYKQHTGESFKISDVQIDVLYTIEDLYTPNSSNSLVLDNVGSMKKSDEENNCSSVLRVSFDGKTMMITGDIYDSDAIMMGMYPAKDLHVDVLQLPHHAFDNHVTFVKTVAPTISFLHQAESAARNRQTLYNVNKNWMPYAGTIYFGNTETVGYCAEEGIFLREPFNEAVDWMDWGNKTWELDEVNPYVSDPVADPEAYYRYTATNALTTSTKAYAIVDDKLGYALGFDAVNGGISNAMPTFRSGDSYYFAASQRRLVNWNMSYSSKGSNANAIVSGATTYYGGLPVNKGSGDYWGTPTKNNGITLGNGDSFKSAGSIYSSWCPFTDQLESKSQWVWMDALSDGTVLLYRRADSIYYPLYRDPGTVTTGSANNTGWGTAKLSKSQINEKRDYFALRLYAYNATPDTMLLSWTGHKDYYANAGISKSQVLSLLTADVRVNYSFQTFPGKGEVFYDRQRTGDPDAGTYRFEFTGGFSGSTPGDYPVVIKYRNHSGKDLELGTFTVHILDRSSDPARKSLFVDFNDDAAARKRYQYDPQYAGINLDGSSRWQFIEYNYATATNDMTQGFVDTLSGNLKLYTKTQDTVSKTLSVRSYVNGYGHLKYDPKDAEVVQIRFKMENLKSAEGQEASFSLWYHKADGSGHVSASEDKHSLGSNFVADGEYMTLTVPLSDAFRNAGTVTGLRPAFFYVIPTDLSQQGCLTIDYIYIGPEEGIPAHPHTVTFAGEDGTTLYEQAVPTGGTAQYTGATPTKASDSTYHYNFAGWVDGEGKTAVMDNVTEDVTFYAAFTSESHVFQENLLSVPTCSTPGQKECRCNCGYSYTETVSASEHSPVEIPGVPATCTEAGMSAGAYCEVCKEVLVAPTEIPALGHSGQVIPGRAPTCLNSGLSDGSVCSACNLTLVEQKIIPRLGHDFSIYTDMGQTHTAQCSRCSVNRTQPHSYEDGLCICGGGEAIAPTEDASLKLNHTLNLASGISVNLAVSKSLLEGFDMSTVYVETEIEIYEGNGKTGTKTVKLYPVDQGSYYYFTLEGLTAVNMNDRVRSVLYGTKNGQPYYSPVDDYSIADYAYSQLNKPGAAESLKILCADLLRYGSATQIFKAYRTDALVDSTMTETHRGYLSNLEDITFGNTNRTLTDLEAPAITWAGKSLDLNSKVVLKFVFSKGTYTGPVEELRLKVRYADFMGMECEQWIGDAEPYGGAGYYAFAFDGLLAAELRSVVSVQVYHGETPLSCTLQYSADTYGNNKTGNLLTLCKALFAYSDSAKTYFAL